jgi:hypothetical protein
MKSRPKPDAYLQSLSAQVGYTLCILPSCHGALVYAQLLALLGHFLYLDLEFAGKEPVLGLNPPIFSSG